MKKAMPTFLQHPLAREITVTIMIKLLVIAMMCDARENSLDKPRSQDGNDAA